MPELPEVETIRRIVERELVGRRLTELSLSLPKLTRDSPLPDFTLLVGQTLLRADRRAKILITDWSGDLSILTHFKLAGQLAVMRPDGRRLVAGHPVPDPEGPLPHKATHLSLRFDDDSIAYYSDIRQFGWWRLLPTEDVTAAIEAFGFGPEGTGGDGFSAAALGDRLANRRMPIKQVLLDQTIVAGLGNIYVDEALHRARLHPSRRANSLSQDEVARVSEAIKWALDRGIEQGGADIRRNKAYPRDGFPAVHARAGERCNVCGRAIEKTRVAGRGTYFCAVCQTAPD